MNRIQEENRKLKLARETNSEILQKKSDARKAIEIRLENQEIELSDKDHFERLFKELIA
jgi:hypothetical protein